MVLENQNFCQIQFLKFSSFIILYSWKVWWGESLANHSWSIKLKPSKFLLTIITFWLNLFIRQTFFRQMLKKSKFAKLLPCQTFPLYSMHLIIKYVLLYYSTFSNSSITKVVDGCNEGPYPLGFFLWHIQSLHRLLYHFPHKCSWLFLLWLYQGITIP